jgi:hypothetical protein
MVEDGQQTLLAPIRHGRKSGPHEAPAAHPEPATVHLEVGIAGQLEAFDLEAGRLEPAHDPPSSCPIRQLTTHHLQGNARRAVFLVQLDRWTSTIALAREAAIVLLLLVIA